jgi:hypothetical protein
MTRLVQLPQQIIEFALATVIFDRRERASKGGGNTGVGGREIDTNQLTFETHIRLRAMVTFWLHLFWKTTDMPDKLR